MSVERMWRMEMILWRAHYRTPRLGSSFCILSWILSPWPRNSRPSRNRRIVRRGSSTACGLAGRCYPWRMPLACLTCPTRRWLWRGVAITTFRCHTSHRLCVGGHDQRGGSGRSLGIAKRGFSCYHPQAHRGALGSVLSREARGDAQERGAAACLDGISIAKHLVIGSFVK